MTRLPAMFLLALAPAMAFATSPFDGTWKLKMDSLQYSGKPTEDLLKDGSYTCKSCVPPFTIKADGQQQPTPVHNTRDHMSVKVVSPTTVEYALTVHGKVIYKNTDTVSADGNTLTSKSMDYSGEKPVAATSTFKRVGPAPAGAHVVSGAWMQDSLPEISEDARFIRFESTDNGLKWTWNGMVTDAKFDGRQYPVKNDPSKTLVTLKKVNDRQVEERDTFEGKLQYVNVWTVSDDGKTLTQQSEDVPHGTKSSFVLEKQP